MYFSHTICIIMQPVYVPHEEGSRPSGMNHYLGHQKSVEQL